MIRLNDLNNFIEASSSTSLTLAAKKLEITQPSLSESIKRFESDINQKVFYRTKNGIALTPQGKSVLARVKVIQRSILNLRDESHSSLTVTLGCHETIGSYFLPKLFSQKNSTLPNFNIELKHGLSRDIQEQIQSGKIDIGIIVNPLKNPDLIIKTIATDNVCIWKSKKGKTQDRAIIDPNLFQTQSIMKKWKRVPRTIIPTTSLDLIARMTASGSGYGIIPERIVKNLKIDLIKVKETPSFKDTFSVVYRPEFGKTKYENFIIKEIISSFK